MLVGDTSLGYLLERSASQVQLSYDALLIATVANSNGCSCYDSLLIATVAMMLPSYVKSF